MPLHQEAEICRGAREDGGLYLAEPHRGRPDPYILFPMQFQVPEEGPVCAVLVTLRQARVDGGGQKDRGSLSMDGREYQSIPRWRYRHGQAVTRKEESLMFFLERTTQRQSPLINAGLNKLHSGSLETDISEETLRTGVVSVLASVTQMAAPSMVPQSQMIAAPIYCFPQQQGAFTQVQQWLANNTGDLQQVHTQQLGTTPLAPSPGQQITTVSTGLDSASSTGYVEAYEPEEPAAEEQVPVAEEQVEVEKPSEPEIPTAAGGDDESNPTAVADPTEVVEDIRGQLLGADEQSLNSPVVEPKNRKISREAEAVPNSSIEEEVTGTATVNKRRKLEEGTEEVNVSLVAINSLVATLQSLKGHMTRNEKGSDMVERALTDMAAQMSQVTDALHRWKKVVNDCAREEKFREERRIEADKRREEAKRKEQEAEVKKADKRR